MSDRWLTPAAKRREVADWLAYRSSKEIPPTAGGKGYPDPIIFAWTDAINAIPWVCTLQSCSGHRTDNGEGGTFVYAAQLWLWLEQAAAHAIYDRLPEVAALPEVETARILMIGGQEILDVIFRGSETAEGLGTTLAPLIAWLESVPATGLPNGLRDGVQSSPEWVQRAYSCVIVARPAGIEPAT